MIRRCNVASSVGSRAPCASRTKSTHDSCARSETNDLKVRLFAGKNEVQISRFVEWLCVGGAPGLGRKALLSSRWEIVRIYEEDQQECMLLFLRQESWPSYSKGSLLGKCNPALSLHLLLVSSLAYRTNSVGLAIDNPRLLYP